MDVSNDVVNSELAIERVSKNDLSEFKSSGIAYSFNAEGSGLKEAIDALVPLAAVVADAYSQKNLAVVKFPPGKGWVDLVDRKNIEGGWKMLNVRGDGGGYGRQAAIKPAGLQPAAVANLALQCVAVAVGQAYMAQINDQLKGLESGVADIQKYLEAEQRAKLKSAYRMLTEEYVARFDEHASSREKTQAALVKLADIQQVASDVWYLQLERMIEMKAKVSGLAKPKTTEIERISSVVSGIEEAAVVAFQIAALSRQVTMQYDGNCGTARIMRDHESLVRMLEEWHEARDGVYGLLRTRVMLLKEAPVIGAKPKKAREALLLEAAARDQVRTLGEIHKERLNLMDFVYNYSSEIIIDGDEIRILG